MFPRNMLGILPSFLKLCVEFLQQEQIGITLGKIMSSLLETSLLNTVTI